MKNLIKKADSLSPTITFYYSNSIKHSSFLSGLLTLIHYAVSIAIICIYITQVFTHTCSTSFYYRVYQEDPGIFEVNNKSFFHYITFKNGFEFDPRAMSVIGVEQRPSYIIENNEEVSLDHWIYQNCTLRFEPKNSKHLKLDKYGLCLTQFYDSKNKKIYSTEEEGFRYPTIQHGTGNDVSFPYSVVIQSCQNETKNDNCYDKDKINEYFEDLFSLVVHIQDMYVDVNNYSHPFVTFLNSFEVGIMQDSVISSNMHFSPTLVRGHEGYVTDIMRETTGYSYDQVVRGNYQRKEHNRIISMLFFWMHNQSDVYERKYYKFQDVLANISAIMKCSSCFFFLVNLMYHNFVIFEDFNGLLVDMQTSCKASAENFSKMQKESLGGSRIKILNTGAKTKQNLSTKISTKVPALRKIDLTFVKMLRHLLNCTHPNNYISKMIGLRKRLLSEEKMIKDHIFLSDLVKLHSNSFMFEKIHNDGTFLDSIICDEFYGKKERESFDSMDFLSYQKTKKKSLQVL